jgi:PAS domain S-box-containing protein
MFPLAATSYTKAVARDRTEQVKNVLILYSFTAREAMSDFSTLESTIRSHRAGPVNFQVEYLESLGFERPGYEEALAKSLAASYRGQKIDLVLTALYPALQFAVDYREQIFPGAPIVFFSVSAKRLQRQNLWPSVTGVTIAGDVAQTVDLALRLQPDTKYMALIGGDSAYERYWLAMVNQELERRASGPKAIDLEGLSTDELLKKIDALPPHTVALFHTLPRDSSKPTVGWYKLLSVIAAKLPTYCLQNFCMGYGAVGGSYSEFSEQGVKAGEIGARVLAGERPEDIPVESGSSARPHVDWRQLQRWQMSEALLPDDAIVLYRKSSFWQRVRFTTLEWTLFAIALSVGALLVVELRRHYLQRRTLKSYLREGEERFRGMTDAMSLLIWMSDERGQVTYANQAAVRFVGADPATMDWKASVHPDDASEVMRTTNEAIQRESGFSKEFRVRRADGGYRWVLDVATPRRNGDGSFAGLIGYGCDITDQRLAQETLRDVGGRLIEAQEQERSRIARELHDDICQKLALLSMEMEVSKRACPVPGGAVEERIEEMRQHCSAIAADVQALSHELHSSRLDYLGLTVALESFCHEFAQQQNINVDIRCENVPDGLSKAIALSLFRIAQEGLHNSLKYSGGDRFAVSLRGGSNRVELEISDYGAGFDTERARGSKGLGLISMQERAHLVNGSFAIESKIGVGTRILVSIPINGTREDSLLSPLTKEDDPTTTESSLEVIT